MIKSVHINFEATVNLIPQSQFKFEASKTTPFFADNNSTTTNIVDLVVGLRVPIWWQVRRQTRREYWHQHYYLVSYTHSAIMDATTNRMDNGRFGQFDSGHDREDNKDMFGGMSIAQYK